MPREQNQTFIRIPNVPDLILAFQGPARGMADEAHISPYDKSENRLDKRGLEDRLQHEFAYTAGR